MAHNKLTKLIIYLQLIKYNRYFFFDENISDNILIYSVISRYNTQKYRGNEKNDKNILTESKIENIIN